MKITLFSALFLIFLVLKLCHVIGWSWVWVMAPLWGVLVLAPVVVLWQVLVASRWRA
ncbi:MAG: hypothetical protein ACRD34_00170 [Bryobacteraceae bacterium]